MTLRAMIADDSRVIRRMLTRALHDAYVANFELNEASNPRQILERTRDEEFDVVFLDWYLPSARGEELVQAIRRQRSEEGPRIVLIAGAGQEAQIEEAARRSGADSWICRPFEAGHLQARLAPLLTSS